MGVRFVTFTANGCQMGVKWECLGIIVAIPNSKETAHQPRKALANFLPHTATTVMEGEGSCGTGKGCDLPPDSL